MHTEKPFKATQASEFQAFRRDSLVYSFGQGLVLFLSSIQAFIIPKYLSVEDYGYWQVFMLYASYVGIIHLGFIDGLLMRWAGKNIGEFNGEIEVAFRFLLMELMIIAVPLALLFSMFFDSRFKYISMMIIIFAIIYAIASFFNYMAQATRNFVLLSVVNAIRSLTFILVLILMFHFEYSDYRYVIFTYSASFVVVIFAMVYAFHQHVYLEGSTFSRSWYFGREHIKIGAFVLMGNLIVIIILTVDRLMVSTFFRIEEFAAYAFALVVLTIFYTFIMAVSQVLFPNLCIMAIDSRITLYRLGKPAIVICWATLLVLYFPISRAVKFYLPDYTNSLPLMQILVSAIGFGSLIQILHVNFYKAYRMQRKYFFCGLMALALSIALNLAAIEIFGTLKSIAFATVLSFVFWYVLNELSLRSILKKSELELGRYLFILGAYLIAFWAANVFVDWFVAQTLVYICLLSIVTWVFLRKEVKELTNSTIVSRP
ncbi:MAG: hypothetical protein GY699_12075 [Desulfobacteraceae bacterium]|nr:hypothetical protein [Desulfobacteraceae bacterium]